MIDDLLYNDREVREHLRRQSDIRLLMILDDVNRSIKNGRDFASLYQTFSIGTQVLKERGYKILRTDDIEKYLNELGGR